MGIALSVWRGLPLWFQSRRDLIDTVKRLQARLEREQEARECLTRQRDTCLDTLDRLRTEQQVRTALGKAQIETFSRTPSGYSP